MAEVQKDLVANLVESGLLEHLDYGTFLPRRDNWTVGTRGRLTYFLIGQDNRITASLRAPADWANQLAVVAFRPIIPEGVSLEDEAIKSRLSGICLHVVSLRKQPVTFHWADESIPEESYGEFSLNLLPTERKALKIERLGLWLPLQPLFPNNPHLIHPPETRRTIIV